MDLNLSAFLINCTYCDTTWKTEYKPSIYTDCHKCKDNKNLTFRDVSNSIDYYAGTTPHKEEKKKEVVLEETQKEGEKLAEDDFPYFLKTWD